MKVLVAYASKRGATAEIAEKIGEVLRQTDCHVDVLPVNRVDDLMSYKAVVLGSAAYIGLWRKEMVTFLKGNEDKLSKMPVWIFSSGPTGTGDPIDLLQGWCYPTAQKPLVESINLCDITCFHGKVDMDSMNFFEKMIVKKVKAPIGDFRDWESITSWAKNIAKTLNNEK